LSELSYREEEEGNKPRMNAIGRNELLVIRYWLLGEENEEADSSKGSASVSLAVSRILRGTSSERFTAKAGEELLVIGYWLLGEEKKKSSVNGHWSLGNRIKMPLLSLGLLSPSETECLKLETLFPFRKRGAGRPLSLKHGRPSPTVLEVGGGSPYLW
jgi:hypothetical protein